MQNAGGCLRMRAKKERERERKKEILLTVNSFSSATAEVVSFSSASRDVLTAQGGEVDSNSQSFGSGGSYLVFFSLRLTPFSKSPDHKSGLGCAVVVFVLLLPRSAPSLCRCVSACTRFVFPSSYKGASIHLFNIWTSCDMKEQSEGMG